MGSNLQDTLNKIEKTYGKGTIQKADSKDVIPIPRISSGSLSLDQALGGGYPTGRVVEIIGWESTSKTSSTLQAISLVQQSGGLAAFIDAEHALDLEWAQKLGVDVSKMYVTQPDNGEQALEILEILIRSGEFKAIVTDSVAALVPRSEIEGEMGESKMGLHARLMSQAMRKITGAINNSDTVVFFINQWREKIGIMFGDSRVATGGNALKFYATQRLEFAKGSAIKDGDNVIGHRIKVKVIKNKVAPPFKKAEFDFISDEKAGRGVGIDYAGEVIDLAVEFGICKKAGSWFSYGETRLGQGRNAVTALLRDNVELTEELRQKIDKKLNES